jgi:hypothetical protein
VTSTLRRLARLLKRPGRSTPLDQIQDAHAYIRATYGGRSLPIRNDWYERGWRIR